MLHIIFFSDDIATEQEKFAAVCVDELLDSLQIDKQFIIAKAYIRYGVSDKSCLIYGGIDDSSTDMEFSWHRVKYDLSKNDYTVFLPLDMDYYDSLASSDDKQNQILAAVLKNYDDITKSYLKEITTDNSDWIKIDIIFLNERSYIQNINIENSTTATTAPIMSNNDVTDLS